jgi:hypothetical protein
MSARLALVEISTAPADPELVAEWLRVVGANVTTVGVENVWLVLPLAADGWGILPALQLIEDAVAAYTGQDGLLLPARVLSEVRA